VVLLAEINFALEGLYWVSQSFFVYRTLYHIQISKEQKRSVTPLRYWSVSILGNLVLGVYGFFIGSISMPLFAIASIPFSLYHIHLERKREVEE